MTDTDALPLVVRLRREPLVHFLGIGVALFALHALVAPAGSPDGDGSGSNAIVVTAGRVESLAETFAGQWNRPPTDVELAGLIETYVREEVLAREAVALGLDRDDTIVRRRLAQKMEFLSADVASLAEPSEADLALWLAGHAGDFATGGRVTFDQIQFDREKRGPALEADLEALSYELNAAGPDADFAARGDGRLLEPSFVDATHADVEALFGPDFAVALEAAESGRWVGPIESGHGVHLVRVSAREPRGTPPLSEVRVAVERAWRDDQARRNREAQLRALLDRYEVTLEPARGAKDEP
jgi:hypothetical protein